MRPTPPSASRTGFLEWYQATHAGQTLRTLEASYLKSTLKLTYNQKTIQVGYLGSEALYIDRSFPGDFLLIDGGVSGRNNAVGAVVRARSDALPVAAESVDLMILAHVLEFAGGDYRKVLGEAERVLKPEGKLFILGLNSWSLHRMLRYLPAKSLSYRSHPVSSWRLTDHLSLQGFAADLDAAFCVPSARIFENPGTVWTRVRAELSLAYAIKAVKRRHSLIPMEPRWITLPSLATGQIG